MTEKKPQLAIVAASFHRKLAEEMVAAATAQAQKEGAEIAQVIRVAGSYEIPLIARQLLKNGNPDAVIALGYIEKGETLHGEVMGHVVHQALMNLQLTYGKPIGIGIIGPGATKEQAEARKMGAARGAVSAVIQSLNILRG